MKKFLAVFLFVALCVLQLLGAVGCKGKNKNKNNSQEESVVDSVTESQVIAESDYSLSMSTLTLEIGDHEQLSVLGNNVNSSNVEWESGNSLKATVQNGLVTAVSEGRTVVIAKYDDEELFCVVTVLPYNNAVPLLEVDTEKLTLLKGTEANRTAVVKYDNHIVSASINYDSSNKSVATVENGIITAHEVGSTTIDITSTYKNMNLYETIDVTVTDFLILFDEYEFSLGLNGSKTLEGKLWTVDNGIVAGATFTYSLQNSEDSSYVSINGSTISIVSLPQGEKTIEIVVDCNANGKSFNDLLKLKISG